MTLTFQGHVTARDHLILGALWRSGGMKSCDFYCKSTSSHESTSVEPFCVKIGWEGVRPPGVSRKKSQKVSDSHRNDVSLLTHNTGFELQFSL